MTKKVTRQNISVLMNTNNRAEKSILLMLHGWLEYAKMHRTRYDGSIGEDYVLGPEWETVGKAILNLLNGETGDLDCGSIDHLIREELGLNDCSLED